MLIRSQPIEYGFELNEFDPFFNYRATEYMVENGLSEYFEWHDDNSLCIVVCSKGYPENYEKNIPIDNLDKILLKSNEFIFHAGTKNIDNKIVSNGGRVLNFVVRSKNFKKNRDRAINLINQVNWVNGFFRSDIAHKVINE